MKFYLDSASGTPIATGTQSFTITTTGLDEGTHSIYIVATNVLGVSNDPNAASSSLQFNVVPLPQGPPPSSPSVSGVSYPVNGQVTVNGTSVPGSRIDITNATLGITVNVYANSSGVFSAVIPAEAGHVLNLVAYDFSQSQSPSSKTTVTVIAPPALDHITVSPTSMTFSIANAYQDITVTGYYQDGNTANVTSKATFTSGTPAVASVNSSGRVVALSNGNATITASVNGQQAQVSVTVDIVVATHITVDPPQVDFVAVGQTQQLTVKVYYSDGNSQVTTAGITYTTGNPAVATVSSSGLVTAKGDGSTQVVVTRSGWPLCP